MNEATVEPCDTPNAAAPIAPIVIGGHSHMCALVGDLYESKAVLRAVADYPDLFALHGPWPRDEAYWQWMKEQSAGTQLVLVWGGNEHNLFYFFEDHRSFDFVSRHVNKLSYALNVVPQRMVRDKFNKASLANLRLLLAEIAKTPVVSLTVVGTPPPKRDNEQLRKILLNEPYFVHWVEEIGEDLETVKILAPHIRLKLWFLLQDMLVDAAREVGAKFIPVAQELMDGEGFLREEYWHHDVTHANRRYGEVVLRRIVEELR